MQYGSLVTPGGTPNAGETPLQCATREFIEETGFDISGYVGDENYQFSYALKLETHAHLSHVFCVYTNDLDFFETARTRYHPPHPRVFRFMR
jgi:8-oxo-dGTP pyrophosphatase MutT (NUDIX family)